MQNGKEGSQRINPVNENVCTIEPHGIYFLSNFAYTHIQTLSSHRYTIHVANTDFLKYSTLFYMSISN